MRLLTRKTPKSRFYIKKHYLKELKNCIRNGNANISRRHFGSVLQKEKLNYARGMGFNCPTNARFLSLRANCSQSRLEMHGVLLVSIDV
jgi:hypothetical protein